MFCPMKNGLIFGEAFVRVAMEYPSWHIDALREQRFAHTRSALTKAVSCIASRPGWKPNAFFPCGRDSTWNKIPLPGKFSRNFS